MPKSLRAVVSVASVVSQVLPPPKESPSSPTETVETLFLTVLPASTTPDGLGDHFAGAMLNGPLVVQIHDPAALGMYKRGDRFYLDLSPIVPQALAPAQS